MADIREDMVRDILYVYDKIAQKFMGEPLGCKITRYHKEFRVSSGRIDLIFIGDNNFLYIIELKVNPAKKDDFEQVIRYYAEIVDCQKRHKLPGISTIPVLFAPDSLVDFQKDYPDVKFIGMKIENILGDYFSQTSAYESFRLKQPKIMPGSTSLVNLNGLISYMHNHTGKIPKQTIPIETITVGHGKSKTTLQGLVDRGEDFDLLKELKGDLILQNNGYEYFKYLKNPEDAPKLIRFLQTIVISDPLRTKLLFGLSSFVESVYEVLMYQHPANSEEVKTIFFRKVMKIDIWKGFTTQRVVFNQYAQLAEELVFINKIGEKFQLTPYGIELVASLQARRSNILYRTLFINP
ncbi:MAG: hypothetical protein HY919_03545 [Elusimicrobia bacterium]|nr:hypothetical protein [Elusimicrobiota bacterium]